MYKKLCLLIVMFMLLHESIFPQEKINISLGIGFLELMNVGMHYQFEQIQLGANIGTWPNENKFSLSSDIRFHFGDSSKFSERKNWFFLFGYLYYRAEDDSSIDKIQIVNFRLGRDFNVSKKIGLSISVGLLGIISNEEVRKICLDCPLGGVDYSYLPSIGLEIFYRLF